ncbi:MAG: hypothetical protein AAGA29_12160 [Planctomycetota bacterium]
MNKCKWMIAVLLFASAVPLPASEPVAPVEGTAADTATAPAPVFTGGVAGFASIVRAEHSADYRAGGGGLYLHNNGWEALDDDQRRQALTLFADRPVAIELGFHPIDGWPALYRRAYLPHGIAPAFIAANAFAGNNLPTPEQWARYTRGLREAGVGDDTPILPTFEYANFGENLPTLPDNLLSGRDDFQQIVLDAGGLVLDTPPQYFFAREQAYRDWVLDALRWCHARGLYTVVIVSPHASGEAFPDDTDRFVDYLAEHDAMPAAWVCENYEPNPADDYPNTVGHEDARATTLGVGLRLLQRLAEHSAPPKDWEPKQKGQASCRSFGGAEPSALFRPAVG